MESDELRLVEEPAIKQLQSLDWRYLDGRLLVPELSDERASLTEVVLEKTLRSSIKKINGWISDENLEKVVRDLTRAQYADLLSANQKIWESLTSYVSVAQDLGSGNKGQTVKIIAGIPELLGEVAVVVESKRIHAKVIVASTAKEVSCYLSDLEPVEVEVPEIQDGEIRTHAEGWETVPTEEEVVEEVSEG